MFDNWKNNYQVLLRNKLKTIKYSLDLNNEFKLFIPLIKLYISWSDFFEESNYLISFTKGKEGHGWASGTTCNHFSRNIFKNELALPCKKMV